MPRPCARGVAGEASAIRRPPGPIGNGPGPGDAPGAGPPARPDHAFLYSDQNSFHSSRLCRFGVSR